nr:MAG TPA: hypothetical protein [Caudoviricetes sp.]
MQSCGAEMNRAAKAERGWEQHRDEMQKAKK